MKACVICDTALTGRQLKYCSPLCTSRGFNDARRSDGRLAAQRAQLKESRAAWQRENRARYAGRYTDTKTCRACGEAFTVRSCEPAKCCSLTCAATLRRSSLRHRAADVARRAARGSSGSRPWINGPCAWCGDDFTAPLGARFCSARCLARSRTSGGRRFKVSDVRRHAIYLRDGSICQLCNEPVDLTLGHTDEWGPTLDHIIPRSRGGDHSDENLRLAHRWCNSVRGDDTYYTAADLVA